MPNPSQIPQRRQGLNRKVASLLDNNGYVAVPPYIYEYMCYLKAAASAAELQILIILIDFTDSMEC